MDILHTLLVFWFELVKSWGLVGVFFLMALESSLVPIPSTLVIPPAVFWAHQTSGSFHMIVVVGAAGSYFGAMVNYYIGHYIYSMSIKRYGHCFGVRPDKIALAQLWVERLGSLGVFFARLLPGFRHIISIPAGIVQMRFIPFSLATIAGAYLWCFLLGYIGGKILSSHPELLESQEKLIQVLHTEMVWVGIIVGMIVSGLCVVAVVVKLLQRTKGNPHDKKK